MRRHLDLHLERISFCQEIDRATACTHLLEPVLPECEVWGCAVLTVVLHCQLYNIHTKMPELTRSATIPSGFMLSPT
jgi:hypothetical protein